MHKINNKAYLQFLGAASTTTGSKYLLEYQGEQCLLECGLFQGLKELRSRNWQPPTFDLKNIRSVVLSHAHIDHSGYLPRLVRLGWSGPIYCTEATAELLSELLPDAAYLQEEEAEYANFSGYSKHRPALPLYTQDDATKVLKMLLPVPFKKVFSPITNLEVIYHFAGHILGAAMVECSFTASKKKMLFTGDLGRNNRPLLPDPEIIEQTDTLILESTYGDRVHPNSVKSELIRIINQAHKRSGALIVPAFAVGRTQELIWHLRQLTQEGLIPKMPIYIDSPMATQVTRIYARHPEAYEMTQSETELASNRAFIKTQVEFVGNRDQSIALNKKSGPFIIISASGMAAGGRVLHHLAQRLGDARTTVLLTGFQAEGTRGRLLQEGKKMIRIHGQEIKVNAQIASLDGLSAHAGQDEILAWLGHFRKKPSHIYLVHGEVKASNALAEAIKNKFRWSAHIAQLGERILLFR